MAARPEWLSRLSKSFKAHRKGRTGWNIEVMRERLRIVSAELPPRPDEPADAPPKRRALTLSTPPGPSFGTEALAEACAIYDAVTAGTWKWPDPDGLDLSDEKHLLPSSLTTLVGRHKDEVIGESIVESTWRGTYAGYFTKLIEVAGTQRWNNDGELLEATLKHWKPNSRARQIAHDRLRRLWKGAEWPWPQAITSMRGNGKAAAPTDGVRAFKDEETTELRERIKRSKLSQSAAVAWDLLAAFGIRPAELKGISLKNKGGQLIATVHREKTTLKGKENFREVPAAAHCKVSTGRMSDHKVPAIVQQLFNRALIVPSRICLTLQQITRPSVVAMTAEGIADAAAVLTSDKDTHQTSATKEQITVQTIGSRACRGSPTC